MRATSLRSVRLFAACCILLLLAPATMPGAERDSAPLNQSGDAFVRQMGNRWVFGTGKVEMTLILEKGRLSLTSLKNTATRRDYVQGPSEISSPQIVGKTGPAEWTLDKVETQVLAQGELLFTLTVRDDVVKLSLHYLIYPHEGIIQQWSTIKNISGQELVLEDPSFLQMHILQKEASQLDFSYMTGGMCFWGSWILKTSALTSTYARHFTSADDPECLPGQECPKGATMGNSVYAPIYVFHNRNTKDGLFVGWDYMGRWSSYIGNYNGGAVNVGLKVDDYKKSLNPGDSVETPKAFTGVFQGDLDEMGNELKDYQYRYKWDYTRDAYFPATRMLHFWWNGASDFDPKHPGADVEPVSTFRKMFRVADLMRYVGADVYWRDYGWWDTAGTWTGPDFGESGRYLAKYGIPQTIYTIVYDAEQGSRVATEHPDWLIAKGPGLFAGQYVLNQATPGVTDWELKLLENQVRKWGEYEWRKDDAVLHEVGKDATPLLAQDQNFRQLLKSFLDRNPRSSFHGCNGGGNDMGYEALRMAVVWQMSDGCVGRYRDYYASYLFPPDKMETQPDNWNPDKIERTGAWRGLLWMSPDMTGDTQNPAKLEEIRVLYDIYHYLAKEGVVGRWVKVYHPRVTGDSPEWYLERLSSDDLRGVIIPSHSPSTPATIDKGDFSLGEQANPAPASGAVTIYPKGLLPATTYNISYQESKETAERTGSDLMSKGITLPNLAQGELIYLNLPMHPGSNADKTPPSPARNLSLRTATHMDFTGVELTWLPASDNNWISYYEVFRNGKAIDKVAKGTYYFDHSLGSDPGARYEVRAVDGSGNASDMAVASGAKDTGVLITDDASSDPKFTGNGWKHEENVWQVYAGTQSRTRDAKDAVEYEFEGNRIAWYGSLGDSFGKADVFIDGNYDRTVDGYDADEIPNVALYARTFETIGRHKIKVVARGEHTWRSSDNWVTVDGFKSAKGSENAVEDAPGQGIVYGGSGWQHGDGWDAAEGKSVSWTGHTADSAQYKFHGDGITWVGKLCPSCGTADVYIDGTLEAAVDTYEPDYHLFRPDLQGGWQAPVFEKTWAAPGEHTIRIVVSTQKNMLSKGHTVYLDAFQISGQ